MRHTHGWMNENLPLRSASSEILVDDIAALEDILGEIILYKPHLENIFVYIVMSALYIVIII